MDALLQDLRFALRTLRKAPGFSVVAVLVLALGIGANTAIFSVVNASLLKPLPYPQAGRLAHFLLTSPRGTHADDIEWAQYQFWHDQAKSFDAVGTWRYSGCNLSGGGEPQFVRQYQPSVNLFGALGVGAILGRAFTGEEYLPGGPSVAMLSYGLWQRNFAGDPAAVGKTVNCNGTSFTVVGVLPRGFSFSGALPRSFGMDAPREALELWVPLQKRSTAIDNGYNYETIGRLKPGVTLAQAQAESDVVGAAYAEKFPQFAKRQLRMNLVPYSEWVTGDVRRPLLLLFATVGLVLLLACANVAGLLLARSSLRRRELAIRAAVGASRGRIVRQLLTESVLLTLLGAIAGVLLALWTSGALERAALAALPDIAGVTLDARVLLYTLVVALAAGVLAGIAPALQYSSPQVSEFLKQTSGAVSRQHTRKALVAMEVAVSVVLLVGAALFVKSFQQLRTVDVGFDPRGMQYVQLSLANHRYDDPATTWRFESDILTRVRALPGVSAAAFSTALPLERSLNLPAPDIGGKHCSAGWVNVRAVSPGYFALVRAPMVRGREFSEADGTDGGKVALVNEVMARQCWEGSDPMGSSFPMEDEPRAIVGIVRDARDQNLRIAPWPTIYIPVAQFPSGLQGMNNTIFPASLILRSSAAQDLSGEVKRIVQQLDPKQPIYRSGTLEEVMGNTVASDRLLTLLVGAFASLALLLTVVGLYGLLSYHVTQRTKEIGLRIALGAAHSDVLRLVVAEGMLLVALGGVAGVAGALALARFVKTMLFGVQPGDPAMFALAAATMVLAGLVACYIPARRATRVDPMVALRYE